MGFKTDDIFPRNITTITPPGRDTATKIFGIADDEGASDTVKVMLPGHASVLGVHVHPSVVGGTGDDVVVTVKQDGSTLATGTFDLKVNGALGGDVVLIGLPNIVGTPNGGPIVISTTSTVSSGGPWKVTVNYVN